MCMHIRAQVVFRVTVSIPWSSHVSAGANNRRSKSQGCKLALCSSKSHSTIPTLVLLRNAPGTRMLAFQ